MSYLEYFWYELHLYAHGVSTWAYEKYKGALARRIMKREGAL